LRRSASPERDAYCREHVTPYLRSRPAGFRVQILSQTWSGLRPELRLTLDTMQDLRTMQTIFARLMPEDRFFSLERVYHLLSMRHPARTAG
jgi:spore coat polysaccharide biosynthesis protein SpsF (cytidylyltransferase family)